MPVRIALDIDDTITALPQLFSEITKSDVVAKVIVVSSRSNMAEVRETTLQELANFGTQFDALYLIENYTYAQENCPHTELDWHQKYLWQKVEICIRESIDIIFEDDPQVLALFETYAPRIQRVQVHKS